MPRKLIPERYVIGTFGLNSPAAAVVEAFRHLTDDQRQRRFEVAAPLLTEYFRERGRSRLGRLLTTLAPFAESYDPIVLVGSDDAVSSAAAFFAATAHPYYNQLSDGGRGGKPRVVFVAPTLDNDRLHAALDLLKSTDEAHVPGHRWGLVIQQPAAGAPPEEVTEVATIERLFVDALGDDRTTRTLVLNEVSPGYVDTVADDSFLTALTIVGTALVGGDVVALFKGAAWFYESLKKATPTECEAVRLADFFTGRPAEIVVWHHAVEPLARRFAAGVPVVVGFDPMEQRNLLRDTARRRIHIYTDVVRRDRLPTSPPSIGDAYREVRAAESAAGTESCEIRLNRLNDQTLGELCAWFEAAKLIADNAKSET